MDTTASGPTLAQLILERKGDRSYGRLAEDCGDFPTRKRLQQLASIRLTNFPDPDTIRGLVLGLGASATEITLASARSVGLPVASPNDPGTLAIAGAADLPQHAQDVLLLLSREMMKLAQGSQVPAPFAAQ